MLYPSINDLRKKADSKYTLVVLAAKRARDLIDGKPKLIDTAIDKPVSIATEEIARDMITYHRSEELERLLEGDYGDEPDFSVDERATGEHAAGYGVVVDADEAAEEQESVNSDKMIYDETDEFDGKSEVSDDTGEFDEFAGYDDEDEISGLQDLDH